MTSLEFLTDNFVMIYELGGLIILVLVGAHISLSMKRKALIAVGLLSVELGLYTAERWTQTFKTLSLMRPLLTAALYSIYPAIIIVLMLLTTTGMSRKKFCLLMIPEMICVPLFFTSQWTHIVFYYHESNNYAGGPVSRLPYILFSFYVIVFLFHNFVYLKNATRVNRMIAAYITLGPLVGALTFMLLQANKDYSSIFTSSILLYFTYLYIHMAKIDPLTDLYNRQTYYQDIEENGRHITGVVSIDMNDLKYLNDTLGHAAGDEALKTVARIMKANCGRNATVYRVGGDEFMIFYSGSDEERIKKAIEKMREETGKTQYVLAFGYSMVAGKQKVTDAIRISDQQMYADKAELKKIRNLNAAIRP